MDEETYSMNKIEKDNLKSNPVVRKGISQIASLRIIPNNNNFVGSFPANKIQKTFRVFDYLSLKPNKNTR